MKKVFYLLFFVLMSVCCMQDEVMQTVEYCSFPLVDDNHLLSTYFVEKYEAQFGKPLDKESFLSGHVLLIDEVQTGISSEWGYFFSIPLLNNSSDEVDACVLFPIDDDLPVEGRTWNGKIGNSIILDEKLLE